MVQVINNRVNKQNKIFKSCYESGIIILKLQHHVPPFIVVVVYNYRIAYFVEVFLYQLAQQVKLSAEIICLEAELREMEETDKGMGISTILDYRTGYPIPQGVSGFEWDKYCRKHDLLNRKRQEQKEVREWIEAIEDIQTRWVFRMWYIERLSWKKIAKKMGVPQNEDYPRLMVRDKYLKNNGIK